MVLGHHASIPLALAILWSDYRFALADIFLKRALAVMALVAVVAAFYLGLFGPHLGPHATAAPVSPQWVLVALALSAGIALSYPVIRRATAWFVDSVLLKRPDTAELRAEIARRLAACDAPDEILKLVTDALTPALSARGASWHESAEAATPGQDLVVLPHRPGRSGVTVSVPTAEPPGYVLTFDSLGDGRRLLSDDLALLESVAHAAARRIDALRWIHERFERDLREEQVAKLATEAELRALQAQLNPHFLFNALNTLGYLMKAAPDRARSTLLDLTKLLRAVLKRSGGDVVTLGQEIDLVESYLAIERRALRGPLAPARGRASRAARPSRAAAPRPAPGGERDQARHRPAPGGRRDRREGLVRRRRHRRGRPPDRGGGQRRGSERDDGGRGPSAGPGLEQRPERLRAHYGARAGLSLDEPGRRGHPRDAPAPGKPRASSETGGGGRDAPPEPA